MYRYCKKYARRRGGRRVEQHAVKVQPGARIPICGWVQHINTNTVALARMFVKLAKKGWTGNREWR